MLIIKKLFKIKNNSILAFRINKHKKKSNVKHIYDKN